MRYAIFTDKAQADSFAQTAEDLCDANKQPADSKIIKMAAWIAWMGKWAVGMEYEPDLTGIEVVDSIEPPTEGEL